MNNFSRFLPLVVVSALVLSLLTGGDASAQQKVLLLENQKSNTKVYLVVGQIVGYRISTSLNFESGRITEITNSTISFESKKKQSITLAQRHINAYKIISKQEKAIGTVAIALGTASLLVGITAQGVASSSLGSGNTDPGAVTAMIAGGAAIIWGTVLRSGKKMELTKWTATVLEFVPEPQ